MVAVISDKNKMQTLVALLHPFQQKRLLDVLRGICFQQGECTNRDQNESETRLLESLQHLLQRCTPQQLDAFIAMLNPTFTRDDLKQKMIAAFGVENLDQALSFHTSIVAEEKLKHIVGKMTQQEKDVLMVFVETKDPNKAIRSFAPQTDVADVLMSWEKITAAIEQLLGVVCGDTLPL